MTGETPKPLAQIADALELLYGIDYDEDSRVGRAVAALEAAKPKVEALAEAARNAENELRMHGSGTRLIGARHVLLAALVPFAARENTDEPSDGRGLSGSRLA